MAVEVVHFNCHGAKENLSNFRAESNSDRWITRQMLSQFPIELAGPPANSLYIYALIFNFTKFQGWSNIGLLKHKLFPRFMHFSSL